MTKDMLRSGLITFIALALGACATVPPAPTPAEVLNTFAKTCLKGPTWDYMNWRATGFPYPPLEPALHSPNRWACVPGNLIWSNGEAFECRPAGNEWRELDVDDDPEVPPFPAYFTTIVDADPGSLHDPTATDSDGTWQAKLQRFSTGDGPAYACEGAGFLEEAAGQFAEAARHYEIACAQLAFAKLGEPASVPALRGCKRLFFAAQAHLEGEERTRALSLACWNGHSLACELGAAEAASTGTKDGARLALVLWARGAILNEGPSHRPTPQAAGQAAAAELGRVYATGRLHDLPVLNAPDPRAARAEFYVGQIYSNRDYECGARQNIIQHASKELWKESCAVRSYANEMLGDIEVSEHRYDRAALHYEWCNPKRKSCGVKLAKVRDHPEAQKALDDEVERMRIDDARRARDFEAKQREERREKAEEHERKQRDLEQQSRDRDRELEESRQRSAAEIQQTVDMVNGTQQNFNAMHRHIEQQHERAREEQERQREQEVNQQRERLNESSANQRSGQPSASDRFANQRDVCGSSEPCTRWHECSSAYNACYEACPEDHFGKVESCGHKCNQTLMACERSAGVPPGCTCNTVE